MTKVNIEEYESEFNRLLRLRSERLIEALQDETKTDGEKVRYLEEKTTQYSQDMVRLVRRMNVECGSNLDAEDRSKVEALQSKIDQHVMLIEEG